MIRVIMITGKFQTITSFLIFCVEIIELKNTITEKNLISRFNNKVVMKEDRINEQ